MKKLTTRLALLALLILFPLISIYYLNKGYKEQLQIQRQLVPTERFEVEAVSLATSESTVLAEDWCNSLTTLVAIDPSEDVWDSLTLLDRGFIDESTFQTVVFWSKAPPLSVDENERIKSYYIDKSTLNIDYSGFMLLDTACQVIMRRPMTSVEDYQLISKAIVLRMPQKKRKFLVFERELEK